MVTSPESPTVEPTPRSRRLSSTERRAVIEEAAASLFGERGYEATTVQDIVLAAGVSKPMLYRHFASKRELCTRLLERRRDELAAAPLDVFLGGEGTLGERLAKMLDAWFAHVAEHPDSSRMLLRDIAGDEALRELQADLRARQRAADVALMREVAPQIPERELEPLGEIIRSSLTGLGLWWLEHPEVPREVVTSAMLRLLGGILAC